MTSVAIISGAVGRIECVMEQATQPLSNKDEAESLLQGLKTVKELLKGAYHHKKEEEEWLVTLEKEIVRISYDIIDAIADAPPKLPKERLAAIVRRPSQRSRNMDLAVLQFHLDKLVENLQLEKAKSPASPTPVRGGLQIEEEKNSAGVEDGDGDGDGGDLLEGLRKALSIEPSEEFLVVCIHGESGMGKSTLARKVFNDDQIRKSFDVLGWVSIKQEFQTRRVLQALLQQLGPLQNVDIRDMSEIQLIEQIFAVLEKKKYLLVLDDIASVEDWQSIRVALPSANSSRLVITTCSDQVARVATRAQPAIYRMPRLTQPETLTMLMEGPSFSSQPESDSVVRALCDISGGSPLITTILGKSLQTEVATAGEQLVRELHSYLPHKGTPKVLGACYKRLALEWKPLLLYLGLFPQGQDIEVDKLYLLLDAEDLLPQEDSSQIFLKSALGELAHKKLVEVQKDKSGSYKSCRLHDQVREFCKFRGSIEDFFEIVDMESSTKLGPDTRRLAIYLSKYRDDKSNPCSSQEAVKQIRSLLIFDRLESEKQSRWPSEINDLKELSRLRVVNFDEVDFRVRKVPRGIDKLVFLRYLSFRGCWLEELPSSLSKLTHLETLDLLVHADCKMIIHNILTNMKKLVHLYFPRLYQSDGKSKVQLQGLERLEILVNLDTEACDVEALSELKKLEILTTISKGHHEDLEVVINFLDEQAEKVQHSSMDIRNLDRYNRDSVTVFKKVLGCQFLHSIRLEGQIGELTEEVSSAPKIAEIELDGCVLEHDPMTVLGRIPNLRSLVLSNDAFVGSEVVISAAPEFPSLRSLKLQNLQFLEKLTIEQGAMPELSSLEVDRCRGLLQLSIPKELHERLKKAQGDNGGDAYSVMPLPPKVHITTTHQV